MPDDPAKRQMYTMVRQWRRKQRVGSGTRAGQLLKMIRTSKSAEGGAECLRAVGRGGSHKNWLYYYANFLCEKRDTHGRVYRTKKSNF